MIEAGHKKEKKNLNIQHQMVQETMKISEVKMKEQMKTMKEQVKKAEEELSGLKGRNEELEIYLISLDEAMNALKQEKKTLGVNLREGFEKQKRDLIEKHSEEIKELKQKHQERSNDLNKSQEAKVKRFEEWLSQKAEELATQKSANKKLQERLTQKDEELTTQKIANKKIEESSTQKADELAAQIIANKKWRYIYIVVGIGMGAVGFALISKPETFQKLSETTQNYVVQRLPSIIQHRIIPGLMK